MHRDLLFVVRSTLSKVINSDQFNFNELTDNNSITEGPIVTIVKLQGVMGQSLKFKVSICKRHKI